MKKKKLNQTQIRGIARDRKATMRHFGPAGLNLLAEVLNWNIETIDPSKFGEDEFRRHLICNAATGDISLMPSSDAWRVVLQKIQDELRDDLVQLLDPTLTLPRVQNLERLLHKLYTCDWRVYLVIDPIVASNAVTSPIYSLAGELSRTRAAFELTGDRFAVVEHVSYMKRFGEGVRDRLYRIIYEALKSGKISNLHYCNNRRCGRFFVGKRPQCSEKCRSAVNNESRGQYFADRYQKQKQNKIGKARGLLEKGYDIDKVLRLTGLTQKALERAPETAGLVAGY